MDFSEKKRFNYFTIVSIQQQETKVGEALSFSPISIKFFRNAN